MQLDKETVKLLKSKGLSCICQLCDCGRSHNHSGCTKNFPTISLSFEQKPALCCDKTDYQATFHKTAKNSPPKMIKPLPSIVNPNPPMMDFRTTNRLAFKDLKTDGRMKPCKLKEQHELLTGAFTSESVYRSDFPTHKPLPVKLERPATQKTQSALKFDSRTMYKDTFYQKDQQKLKSFQELPSFTYSVLYPDRGNPVDKISLKNLIHSGEFAAKPGSLAPREPSIKIGLEGTHDMVTTNEDTFKTHAGFVREQPVKVVSEWKPRPKFECKTQAQDDFKGFGKKMPDKRKPITPPPETIDLKVDNKQYFETTKGREHRVTWDKSKVHRPALVRVEERYSAPKEKFEAFSVMRSDFKEHRDVRPVAIEQPDQTKVTDAKFFSDTSYKTQFPKYDSVEVKRYGDPCEQRYYVRPFGKFPEEPSVMRGDFRSHGEVRPRSPILPENKRHADGGKFHGETSYGSEFTQKSLQPCTFKQMLAEKDVEQLRKKVSDSLQAGPSSFGRFRKKTKGLTAAN